MVLRLSLRDSFFSHGKRLAIEDLFVAVVTVKAVSGIIVMTGNDRYVKTSCELSQWYM